MARCCPSGPTISEAYEAAIAALAFKQWARELDAIVNGAVVRDVNEAMISADVIWPDGTTGTYTADVVNVTWPSVIDAYHVTYVGENGTVTYTQPLVTRDVNGAVINLPEIVVS